MIGISVETGKHLSDLEHLRQSLRVLLTTRIGTRVMRRDYGSDLPRLVDSPIHPDRYIEFYAATIIAIDRWEPRLKMTRVEVQNVVQEHLFLRLFAEYLPSGEPIAIEGIQVS